MNQLPPIIHPSWHEYLQPLFDDPKMQMIKDICAKVTFYPPGDLVFRVFKMPIDKIRVVIVGQDPYIKPNEAIGLAFAVPENISVPPSLKVISKEISRSEAKQAPEGNKTLQHWVKQGVFLLNTALTVEAGKSGSHARYWEWFTRRLVDIISKHHNSIWILWGSKAQAFESYIDNRLSYAMIDNPHLVNITIKGNHPAAETYDSNTPYKFTGCNHFNICNDILKLKGEAEINW